MRLKIFLIGKTGQVGGELLRLLPSQGEVVAFDHQHLDLAKPGEIRRLIREFQPALIVNAAAYTSVDRAEADEAAAWAVNAEGPLVLAEEAKRLGAALIHYSTDHVFDGSKCTPYEEIDPTDPINAYGRTKLAGEKAIREVGVAHLIFRTEWVYATRGRNFLLTILKLATQREELRIVSDQIGAPTSSLEIARATVRILAQINEPHTRRSPWTNFTGTYHMTAAGETSWHNFAKTILEEASQVKCAPAWFAEATSGKPLIARRIIPIPSDEYHALAQRPSYSVLSNARLTAAFGVQLPDWRLQLKSLFAVA
jgi:dTDP-4-dehydrorhamnose reductase